MIIWEDRRNYFVAIHLLLYTHAATNFTFLNLFSGVIECEYANTLQFLENVKNKVSHIFEIQTSLYYTIVLILLYELHVLLLVFVNGMLKFSVYKHTLNYRIDHFNNIYKFLKLYFTLYYT